MSQAEKDTLLTYLSKYLEDALAEPNPGIIPPRRLSRREYKYAIQDLLGVNFDTDAFFPKDASGGEGFDNYAKTLYLTPLLMERYLEATEKILEEATSDLHQWREIVPEYKEKWYTALRVWWYRQRHNKDISMEAPLAAAQEVILPFAIRAYRRFLSPDEQSQLLDFFKEVYNGLPEHPASL